MSGEQAGGQAEQDAGAPGGESAAAEETQQCRKRSESCQREQICFEKRSQLIRIVASVVCLSLQTTLYSFWPNMGF